MAGAVMAGEAIHAEAEEYPADIRCDLINPVQPVYTFIIIGVGPQAATRRDIADRIIKGESRWKPLRVLRSRRNEVREDFVVWPIDLQPLLCPKMKLCFAGSEQLAKVIRPLIRKRFGTNQRIDNL